MGEHIFVLLAYEFNDVKSKEKLTPTGVSRLGGTGRLKTHQD
jgi:hypothetical protein